MCCDSLELRGLVLTGGMWGLEASTELSGTNECIQVYVAKLVGGILLSLHKRPSGVHNTREKLAGATARCELLEDEHFLNDSDSGEMAPR